MERHSPPPCDRLKCANRFWIKLSIEPKIKANQKIRKTENLYGFFISNYSPNFLQYRIHLIDLIYANVRSSPSSASIVSHFCRIHAVHGCIRRSAVCELKYSSGSESR